MIDLTKLESLSQTLNKESDKINNEIKFWEDKINILNLGIEVLLPISNDYRLGFGRIENGWHFIYQLTSEPFFRNISNGPRIVRLALFNHLSAIIAELERKAQELLTEIESKIK